VSRHASPHTVHAAITETRPARSVLPDGLESFDDDDEDKEEDDGRFSQSTRPTVESDCDISTEVDSADRNQSSVAVIASHLT